MARIRTIKPEFFTSEDIVELEPLARLLYIALWCEADKEGRLTWKPKTFKMRYLPADDCDVDAVCDALVTRRLVIIYGDGLAVIPSFKNHQHINPREKESVLPAPSHEDLTREARVSDAAVTRREEGRNGREGKGKEGKEGKEGNEDECYALVPPVGETISDSRQVFEYWQEKMNHPRANLDVKRQKAIKGRLKDGYTVDDLCRAVDGCKLTPYNMGQNKDGTVYDDIELICRDGPHVDRFLKAANAGLADMSPGLQNQVDILDEWVKERRNGQQSNG